MIFSITAGEKQGGCTADAICEAKSAGTCRGAMHWACGKATSGYEITCACWSLWVLIQHGFALLWCDIADLCVYGLIPH